MELTVNINGFEVNAKYEKEDIEKTFYPLIEFLIRLQEEKGRRIIVFLAGPPGIGKSTFVACMEMLASEKYQYDDMLGIGIDGFHYYNDYLIEHNLKQVKGSIQTFHKEKLVKLVKQMASKDIFWPIYDRNLHNPVEDAIKIDKHIIILEGNYLAHPQWVDLKEYCDFSIFLRTSTELVKERLIQRKITGGLSEVQANEFYHQSDKRNVEEVLQHSNKTDIEIYFDGKHYIKNS
ncbi:nucleoside/nucleotide kinase family protein [Tannockella kyphosi]|uniref:nucleoside/nucleotide kinase family protein n=1 Tax=Tannockella kyphosi TaxID=2899121 RepID=UPI0020123DFC|nr:nucleoside/nucleotide kinase family protein [Tannockella kyphosi]